MISRLFQLLKKVIKFYLKILKDKVALIIGSEDKGISKSILKLCDYSLKIPMYGNLKSLNVSVSTGIFIYEILRKRRF